MNMTECKCGAQVYTPRHSQLSIVLPAHGWEYHLAWTCPQCVKNN